MTAVTKDSVNKTNVRVGDRVLVRELHPGVVRYVGDLDSEYTNDRIFVGVKLDEAGEYNIFQSLTKLVTPSCSWET